MPGDLPDYYFRTRENGAAVFRVDSENRSGRMELVEIAAVNIKNGNVKPHGDTVLSPADLDAIRTWSASRSATLAGRDIDDILRTVDHLNATAHWAQSKASDNQLDQVTDPLLLAMHDLRSTLVRRKADRMGKDQPSQA